MQKYHNVSEGVFEMESSLVNQMNNIMGQYQEFSDSLNNFK